MISKEKKNTLHIASCSFGKDSLATILLALEHGEPLDEAVYCEVMFDKRTSCEVPEHRAFIYETAIPRLEQLGVPVRVLRSDKTYLDLFAGTVTRGPKKGLRRGFPLCGHCYVQRDCKLRPIRRYNRTLTPDTVQYVGIAYDEQKRLSRLKNQQVSLLAKYKFTEEDAKQLCQTAGLLSPVYAFTDRGGCWFCPNARKKNCDISMTITRTSGQGCWNYRRFLERCLKSSTERNHSRILTNGSVWRTHKKVPVKRRHKEGVDENEQQKI